MMPSYRLPISISELYRNFVVYYGVSSSQAKHDNQPRDPDDDDDEDDDDGENDDINGDVIRTELRQHVSRDRRVPRRREIFRPAIVTSSDISYLPSDVITARNITNTVHDDVIVEDDVITRPPMRKHLHHSTASDSEVTSRTDVGRCKKPRPVRLPRCSIVPRQLTTSSSDVTFENTAVQGTRCQHVEQDTPTISERHSRLVLNSGNSAMTYDVSEAENTSDDVTAGCPAGWSSVKFPEACCRPVNFCTKKRHLAERVTTQEGRTTSNCLMSSQKLVNRLFAEEPRYIDPMVNSTASFQQRVCELVLLEAQTVRWEKTKRAKKRQPAREGSL